MRYFFGLIPNTELQQKLTTLKNQVTNGGNGSLHIARDAVVHEVTNELIAQLLGQLLHTMDAGKQKDMLTKTISVVRSASHTLVNQLIGKDKDNVVMPSAKFFVEQSLFVDANGVERLGFVLDDALASCIKTHFQTALADEPSADVADFTKTFNQLADSILAYFVTDFAKTLNLGFIKRKAVPLAESAVSAAVHMGINRLFPELTSKNLADLSQHYDDIIITMP